MPSTTTFLCSWGCCFWMAHIGSGGCGPLKTSCRSDSRQTRKTVNQADSLLRHVTQRGCQVLAESLHKEQGSVLTRRSVRWSCSSERSQRREVEATRTDLRLEAQATARRL